MARLAAVFMAAQLYRLWPSIGIRLETSDYFYRDFPLDESFNVAQKSTFIHADQ